MVPLLEAEAAPAYARVAAAQSPLPREDAEERAILAMGTGGSF